VSRKLYSWQHVVSTATHAATVACRLRLINYRIIIIIIII